MTHLPIKSILLKSVFTIIIQRFFTLIFSVSRPLQCAIVNLKPISRIIIPNIKHLMRMFKCCFNFHIPIYFKRKVIWIINFIDPHNYNIVPFNLKLFFHRWVNILYHPITLHPVWHFRIFQLIFKPEFKFRLIVHIQWYNLNFNIKWFVWYKLISMYVVFVIWCTVHVDLACVGIEFKFGLVWEEHGRFGIWFSNWFDIIRELIMTV